MRNTSTLRGGRYLVQNRLLLGWLRATDVLCGLAPARGSSQVEADRVREVLVAVGGHIGDAIIATAFLARVQRAFPGARIGVLTASWSRHIFEGHPRVARVHVRDHWRHERRAGSWMRRLGASLFTARRARAEIARQAYDVAMDLSPYWPNAAVLLWRTGIPVRVGFTSGGRGALYTHPVDWTPGRHASDDHLHLLHQVAPTVDGGAARYELPPSDGVFPAALAHVPDYVVLHVGAGHPLKEWPLDRWIEVARRVDAAGVPVVITGRGPRQATMTREIARHVPVVNLCDALDWRGFRAVIEGARVVLTVDTVAGHLAAAVGTPCVVVMAVLDDARRWRPVGERVAVVPYRVYSEAPEPPASVVAVLDAASAFLPALAATPRS